VSDTNRAFARELSKSLPSIRMFTMNKKKTTKVLLSNNMEEATKDIGELIEDRSLSLNP
jgi:hypothetical protein